MPINVKFRRGTSTEWIASNPVLELGEMVIDTTVNAIKIGNGTDQWTARPYAGPVGPNGINGIADLPFGSLVYFPEGFSDPDYVRCDASLISTASYPNFEGIFPYKAGFSGGVGAEYGTASANNVTVIASSTLNYELLSVVDNLTDSTGSWLANQSYDYPVWHSEYSISVSDHWVKYVFPVQVVINSYYITARSSSWIPTAWNFQGSNDGSSWTTIDTLNGQFPTSSIASSGLTTSAMSQYSSTNTTAYKEYRLQFLNTNYGTTGVYVAISELVMVGLPVAPDTSFLTTPGIPSNTYGLVKLDAYIKYTG
jgi:hypothetical protein